MKLPFYFKTMGMRQDFESCRFSIIIGMEVFFMKYPKFLNVNNNTIGVCAMSSGVGHKLDSFDESIKYIKSHGFNVIENFCFSMFIKNIALYTGLNCRKQ